jgi:hypothetical protein
MKIIIVLTSTFVILMVSACTGRKGNIASDSLLPAGSKGTSEITFREYQHDFGKVAEGEKLSFIFTFDNTGTGDLVINSASTNMT